MVLYPLLKVIDGLFRVPLFVLIESSNIRVGSIICDVHATTHIRAGDLDAADIFLDYLLVCTDALCIHVGWDVR
jgi:hypothetical protein